MLALACVVAFLINLPPAFMPPTWAVLAVFHVTGGVPLIPVAVGGAIASALGRMLLAMGSARLCRFLPQSDVDNAQSLGRFLNRHRRWRDVIVFGYCLGPFPSNPLFIAAGIGRIPLIPVTIAFLVSRIIADTFWIWTADAASTSVGSVFSASLTDWKFIAFQVLSIGLLVLIFRLPWAKWLGVETPGAAAETSKQGRFEPAKS